MDKTLQKYVKDQGLATLPDNKTHINRMEIRSSSSTRVYVVAQSNSSGEWQCSCPGWVLKKPGKQRTCKHLQAMMPVLLISDKKSIAGP